MSDNLRDRSRNEFSPKSKESMTFEEVQLGAIQRIADSLERIEKPFKELIESNEYLRKRVRNQNDEIHKLEKKMRSYKGWITRLKNQLMENQGGENG